MKTLSTISHITGIFLLAVAGGCAQQQYPEGYTLKGTIQGVNAGKIRLVKSNPEDRTSATIDSAEFTNGSFTLKGKVESPEVMTLTVEPGNWSLPVFVENKDITVKADTANAVHYDWTAYGGSKGAEIKTYAVTGSESQDHWMRYENDPALKSYEPVFATLQKAYSEAGGDKEKQYAVKNQMDSVRGLLTALQKRWIDSFIKANPSSAAGAYLLNNYYMFNEDLPLKDMESLTGEFTGTAKSTLYFKILSEALAKRRALQPGNPAPDFTLKMPDSSSFTLSSLRGKYVMLDFWASWCVPCRKAIPHWKEVYRKYQSRGFEIVSITNDSRWKDWFKALEDEKMPWIQVADEFPIKNMPARLAELYMIPYLPTYILLDKDGKIVLHNGTEAQIDEKLKGIFGG